MSKTIKTKYSKENSYNLVKHKEDHRSIDEEKTAPLVFSFSKFKMHPINIEDVFNNFFSSQEEYIRKITILIEKALPLLSNENESIFTDPSKSKTLHLHKLQNKEKILQEILERYQFSSKAIDNLMDGSELYQLEVPYENGATRVVFERINNLISFLFLDPNHHIYMNKRLVYNNRSLLYEFCPVNQEKRCERLDYFNTCFAFEYLDEDLYKESFLGSYDPNESESAR